MSEPKQEWEELLTVAEVAARLKVDTTSVQRWIRAGKIGPIRHVGGRLVRVPVGAVNRFLENSNPAQIAELPAVNGKAAA